MATICLPGWRSFSRYYLVYKTSPYHIRLFSASPLTHFFSFPRVLVYLFFLAGPGPLHEIHCLSVFAQFIGPCKYVFIPIYSLNPPCISKYSSSFTLNLSASLSLISILLFTSVLYPENLCGQQYLFLFSSYILTHFLDTAIPPFYSSSPFCYFLSYSPITYSWQHLFGMFLALCCHFSFLTPLFV